MASGYHNGQRSKQPVAHVAVYGPAALACLYFFLFLFAKVIHAGPKISHNQWGKKIPQSPHLFASTMVLT